MKTESSKSKVAVVGRAEKLAWFDTMPGEQMAIRVNSSDVGGAFSVIEVHVPPYAPRAGAYEAAHSRRRFGATRDQGFRPLFEQTQNRTNCAA